MEKSALQSLIARLTAFLVGQGALQCLQLLAGLMLVWLLSVQDFALYAIFTGAMGFSSLMIGFGLAPTVMALVGADIGRTEVVGRYVSAAWRLRMLIFAPVTALGVAFIYYTGTRIGISTTNVALLSVALSLSNFFASQMDLFGIPLRMAGRLRPLYLCASGAEVIKVVLVLSFWFGAGLNALTAAVATVIAGAVNYLSLRRCSRIYMLWPSRAATREQRELWHLISPRLPNMIFGALQGQITIAVASIVGSSQQIASVGALARLARVMEFLQAANPMVVGPLIAKTREQLLWPRIRSVLIIAFLISCLVALTGWIMPDALLAILGPKYQHLNNVVWVVALAAGVSYFGSVLETVASYRRWVSWWASFATIGLIIAVQGIVAVSVDLRTVLGVLLLGIAAALPRVVVLVGVLAAARWRPGWLRDPKMIG